MNHIVIASLRPNAGKTSFIVGLAKAAGRSCGYMKPFGDRLLYKKKRLWDYDSALVTNLLGLTEVPEEMSLGFEHSKMKFSLDQQTTREKVIELAKTIGKGKEVLFVEAGRDMNYGMSVHLDALSIAKYLKAKLVILASGSDSELMDDLLSLQKNVDFKEVDFAGVVINKVQDKEDFRTTYLEELKKAGIKILGILPYETELTFPTVEYIGERLFAKVVGGENMMGQVIKNILVGAMTSDSRFMDILLHRDKTLLITSGDRNDIVLAALEGHVAGIILTNNILPPANIIAKVMDKQVPLLLVPFDTFETAKQIDKMDVLLTKNDHDKAEKLAKLVKEHVKVNDLLK